MTYNQPPSGPQSPYPPMPPMGGQPAGGPPDNYLVWAILSTLFCCTPVGIASIVFAARVNSKWAQGDFQGALDSSKKAKTFAITSAVLGLVFIILYTIVEVSQNN